MRSPPDMDDNIFERLARSSHTTTDHNIPSIDLRRPKPPRDQGTRDTCAAFAAAGLKEIQEFQDVQFNEYMSPEFIYFHRENKPAHGMFGRNVFKILQQIGSVPESVYPYGSTEAPDENVYDIAANYKIANYARITSATGLRTALREIGPALVVLPLGARRPEFWLGCGEGVGGHAVICVGYDEKGFILRNSWGDAWNGDGHVLLPYADWPAVWECWVGIDEKSEVVTVSPQTPDRRRKWSKRRSMQSDDSAVVVTPPRDRRKSMSIVRSHDFAASHLTASRSADMIPAKK